MLGLMVKDFLVGKKYLRSLTMIIVIYIAMAMALKNFYIISGIVAMLALLFCLSSFTYDEAAKWDAFAATMPVKRSTIVGARYVISILITAASTVLCGVLLVLLASFGWGDMRMQEVFSSLIGCMVAGIVIICIYIPLVYRFGPEKVRYLIMGIFVALALAGFLISKFSSLSLPELPSSVVLALCIGGAVLVCGGSYFCSVRIYEKKEF